MSPEDVPHDQFSLRSLNNARDNIEVQEEAAILNNRSKWRITAILAALFLSLFVAALDATIVATAVPVISHDLHSATGYTWVGATYMLASAAAGPIWARLSDIWGRKMMLLTAIALFFASSLLGALAPTMKVLLAARTLQGVSGGGLLLLVHVVLSDLFSLRHRSLFMGLTEGVWALAGGVGPLLGGTFVTLVSWRWCFYINLPVCGLAFPLILLSLNTRHEYTSLINGLKAIDWLGMVLFLAFSLLTLLGLDFGGIVFPWTSAKVIVLIAVGGCMLFVFAFNEVRFAKYPLIPMKTLTAGSTIATLCLGFCHGFVFIYAEYYLPLFFQSVMSATPLLSGVLLLPLIVCMAVSGIVAGVLIHRTGRFRELIWVGTTTLCLANGLFISVNAHTSIAKVIGFELLLGFGSGLLFEAPIIAIQTVAKQQDVATATSTYTFIRSMALAMAVVIGGLVFQNGMSKQSSSLAHAGLSADLLRQFSGSEAAANVQLIAKIPVPAQKWAVKAAFAWAMRNMWIMNTAIGFLGVVAGAFIQAAVLHHTHEETVTGIREKRAATDAEQ